MAKKRNRVCNQQGVALIASVGISLMLMVVAIALAYRVGYFTRKTSMLERKDQMAFTADYAIEAMRYYLWNNDCAPPTWCGAVDDNTQNTRPEYIDFIAFSENPDNYTGLLTTRQRPPEGFSDLYSGDSVELKTADGTSILKINHTIVNAQGQIIFDWNPSIKPVDQIYRYSIYTLGKYSVTVSGGGTQFVHTAPDIMYVLVGIKKYDSNNPNRVLERSAVEVALHFSVPCKDDYKQFGQCRGKEGASAESNILPTAFKL